MIAQFKESQKTKFVDKIYLNYSTAEGKNERIKLIFRDPVQNDSQWQMDVNRERPALY